MAAGKPLTPPLIRLQGASVWLQEHRILHELDFGLEKGAHTAILGRNGAGKSTFMRLLSGELWPRPHNSRLYTFDGVQTWSPLRARENVAHLSPEIQNFYARRLQDGADNERGWQLDVRECVATGYFGSHLLHQQPTTDQWHHVDGLLERTGLAALAERPLQRLSQGQMRRTLLARSLVKSPQVLLLDEAASGLDARSRHEWLEVLEKLAQGGETTLVLTSHRAQEIPPSVQQWYEMREGSIAPRESSHTKQKAAVKPASRIVSAPTKDEPPLFELENVSVFLDGKPILRDLNWVWRRGEHWNIEGANGSGKSTLLRLLRGHLAPAFGGEIARFGEPAPRPVWEWGTRIALISPALQARFNEELSVEDAVATGFFDSFLLREALSESQRETLETILGEWNLLDWRKRRFDRLSYGQTRRVLMARAFVTDPEVVLLDESLDGLDTATRDQYLEIFAHKAQDGTHFAVASHHGEDFPSWLNRHLVLRDGIIAVDDSEPGLPTAK